MQRPLPYTVQYPSMVNEDVLLLYKLKFRPLSISPTVKYLVMAAIEYGPV